jgi:hypothetical protein
MNTIISQMLNLIKILIKSTRNDTIIILSKIPVIIIPISSLMINLFWLLDVLRCLILGNCYNL